MVQELSKLNDQVTDSEKPDPHPLPVPTSWHIIVRQLRISAKTKSGILLPDKAKDDIQYLTNVARVLSVGPACFKNKEAFPPGTEQPFDVGDYVVYSRHKGTKFVYKDVILMVLNDTDIIMKVDDPKDIDPRFALMAETD